MSALTSHVLDVATGSPAPGIEITLLVGERVVACGHTGEDGRITDLGPAVLEPGDYRLRFDVAEHFARTGRDCLFPEVVVAVALAEPTSHLHVPLLVTPNSHAVYRGS